MPIRPARASVVVAALAVASSLSLAACGSDSLESGGAKASSAAGSATAAASQAVDQALTDAMKNGEVIDEDLVGNVSDLPIEEEGRLTASGLLFTAAAQKLGLKAEFQNAEFPSIILGVTSGKFDVGVSSFTINADRKQKVNMVQYFNAGTLWAVKKGNPKQVDPAKACGLKVGVQKGTVQIDDLTARSKKCTDAGQPAITQIVETEQSKVTADLSSGKVDAMAADSPITNYAVKQTNGQLEKVGELYDSAPYGIVVPKDQQALAEAIGGAFAAMEKSGDYKKVLEKWNNADGAVTAFPVNP